MPTPPLTDQRVLAPRTLRAYASDWALFTDWCHTTGHRGLPADPGTVVDFLCCRRSTNGGTAVPAPPVTPHSLSRRVRDLLAADLGAHREYPVDPDEDTAPAKPAVPVVGRGVYSEQDRKRAWERRRHDLRRVAEVHDSLAEVDRRIAELDRRAAVVLAGQERAPARSADGAPAEPR